MPKGQCHDYTLVQLEFLKKNKALERSLLTKRFNEEFGTNQSKAAISGVCKRNGWLTGRTGFFNKKNKPWNAGTKGLCKSNSTSFKKGSIPLNLKPIGHERICSKDGIILIKVNEPNPHTESKTRYRPKHHVTWEKFNGPIPKGMVVRFIDGDKINCDIENLEMVTKAVNLRMNQMNYANLPGEIKPTAKLHAQLQVATFAAVKRQ